MTNKKIKKNQGQLVNVEMEHLSRRDEGLAVETDETEPTVESCCLGIFPEEVWLEILDMLIHSKDILNVLKAFPELDKAFQNKRACWLFDQVLPHLMSKHLVIKKNKNLTLWNHVESSELLKLRLISKRWKKVVEMVIESNADRHPINSGIINGKKTTSLGVALPVNHFNYFRIHKYHLGATVFRTPEQINEFLEEMNDFQGNPFPGKYLYFQTKYPGFSSEDHQEFMKNAVELLQKFGRHVLVLDLEIRDNRSRHLERCKAILKGLSSVPNLQSLKICLWGSLDRKGEEAKATNDFFSKAENLELFPKLEKLESFEMEVYFEKCIWVKHMIRLYASGGGLRKLALGNKYWNAEMASNLKNLTELHLLLQNLEDYNVSEIRNVLGYFPDGQLKKFCLTDNQGICLRNIYIDELIGMLADFQIENVAFEKLYFTERRSEMEAPGITSLHLDDHWGLTYEFLKGLPNLRFLSVHVSFEVVFLLKNMQREGLDERKRILALASGVRQYFWRADKNYEWEGDWSFDIWKECPKLEMLTASVGNDDGNVLVVQFVREHGNKPFWGWSGIEENGEVGEEGVEIN